MYRALDYDYYLHMSSMESLPCRALACVFLFANKAPPPPPPPPPAELTLPSPPAGLVSTATGFVAFTHMYDGLLYHFSYIYFRK